MRIAEASVNPTNTSA